MKKISGRKSRVRVPLSYNVFFVFLIHQFEGNNWSYSTNVWLNDQKYCRHADIPKMTLLKGQSHNIFDLSFLSNCTPGSPDSWATLILHIDSILQSNLMMKIDSAQCRNSVLCGIAQSRDSLLCGIVRGRLPAVPHSAESARKFYTR
jgi:hypothetical protein